MDAALRGLQAARGERRLRLNPDFWILLALLAAAVALVYRRRLERARAAKLPVSLDDELIHQIEHEGWLDIEEPNDLDRIREEEERFWEESFDEPEEY